MKKLLTAVCLLGLLSVPSVVFAEGPCEPGEMSEDASAEEMMEAKQAAMNSAECTRSRVSAVESAMASGASWYGSLRAGIQSDKDGETGVANGGSRFGVMGSSEVAEGLTAVYRFEHNINSTTGDVLGGGRLGYVGLSGGFGTLSMGRIFAASGNSFGAITDNSTFLGSSGVNSFISHALSYAVSVENISIQVDAGMNKDGGKTADKNVDQVELGVSMGFGEAGKIAFAHISHDSDRWTKNKSNFVAAEYSIGGMTAYLGAGQTKNTSSRDMKDPTLRVDHDKDEGSPTTDDDGNVVVMGFDADGDGMLEGYEKTLAHTITTAVDETKSRHIHNKPSYT